MWDDTKWRDIVEFCDEVWVAECLSLSHVISVRVIHLFFFLSSYITDIILSFIHSFIQVINYFIFIV